MLQKGIIVCQRGGGKANSSASGRTKRGLLHSLSPSVAAEARPAAADRLVPARSLPGSLLCVNPGTDGERRAKEKREGSSSFFFSASGTNMEGNCLYTVHPTWFSAVADLFSVPYKYRE